jgi:predicted metalloprotease
MKRVLVLIVAALRHVVPLAQSRSAQSLDTAKGVVAWSVDQLDGYYRTLFALQGRTTEYRTPKVTVVPAGEFVYTGCGYGKGERLAFYCPADEQIVFSEEFANELHAEDDWLPAYVVAHEWAHHVQHLSGTGPRYNPEDGDWDQVYVIENELRADCMSGSWMRSIAERGFLAASDMPAVLMKASQIGDLGLYGRGTSHGTGIERLRAVFVGYEEGIVGCMAITPMTRSQTVALPTDAVLNPSLEARAA